MERRLQAIEKELLGVGCPNCRDESPLAIVIDQGQKIPDTKCPQCERIVRQVIVITERRDGPQ